MKKQPLFALWAVMFIVCAGLGFIREPAGTVRTVLTLLSVLFFLPPALLLYGAAKDDDRNTLLLVRNLSAASLGLTAALLVGNFLSVLASEAVGDFLYTILIVVSSPMVCSGSWAMSLFLWACLLMGALQLLKKKG